jgi:hypothetical protein
MARVYPFTMDENTRDPEMGVSIDFEVNVSIHLEMSICDPEMGEFIDPEVSISINLEMSVSLIQEYQ